MELLQGSEDLVTAQLLQTEKNTQRLRQLRKLFEAQAEEAEELRMLRAAQARLATASQNDTPANISIPTEIPVPETSGAVEAFLNSFMSPEAENGPAANEASTNRPLVAEPHSEFIALKHADERSPIQTSLSSIANAPRASSPQPRIPTAASGNSPAASVGVSPMEQAPAETSLNKSDTEAFLPPPVNQTNETVLKLEETPGSDHQLRDAQQVNEPALTPREKQAQSLPTNGFSIKGSSRFGYSQPAQNLEAQASIASPTWPPSSVKRLPPIPNFPIYQGKTWDELRLFIDNIESHLSTDPAYSPDARKVELGVLFLHNSLRENWHHHNSEYGNSWSSYRRFLAHHLSRFQNPATARKLFGLARQLNEQPVRHFALWLMQWEPHLPSATDHGLMGRLYKGVLPCIKYRAHEPPTQFRDFDCYVAYLQVIEKDIPERSSLVPDSILSLRSSEAKLLPRPYREPHRGQSCERPRSRSGSNITRGRSLGLAQEYSSVSHPPEPHCASYQATGWQECTNLIGALNTQFKRNSNFYHNDLRKVQCGERFLTQSVLKKWGSYKQQLVRITWLEFCFFLVKIMPSEGPAECERGVYAQLEQRPGQTIKNFALSIVRYSRSWKDSSHDPMSHMWRNISPSIRRKATKNYEDFDNFGDFVEYLAEIEDKLQKDTRGPNRAPKRPREHSPVPKHTRRFGSLGSQRPLVGK